MKVAAAVWGHSWARWEKVATVVGFVAGFGELLGYSLHSVSGYLADKTHRYWIVTYVGYAVNMLAVPALALAGSWQASSHPHDCRAHWQGHSTPGSRNHVVVYRSAPRQWVGLWTQ